MKLYVIDGNCISFRMFAASKLHTSTGKGTAAILGFPKMIRDAMEEHAPDRIVVAWDQSKSKHRKEIFPGYKASRGKDMTEKDKAKLADYRDQQLVIKGILMAMGVDQASAQDIEADDICAWYAATWGQQYDVTIVSTDQDLYGLVCMGASVWEPFGEGKTITHGNFQTHKPVRPDQWLDFRVICGDQSDEIPGVHGVGKKGAANLLAMFGNCDGIRAHGLSAPGLTKRDRNAVMKIIDQWDVVERNRLLMDLTWITTQNFVVPVAPGRMDLEALNGIFTRYQLLGFLGEWQRWVMTLNEHHGIIGGNHAPSNYGGPTWPHTSGVPHR